MLAAPERLGHVTSYGASVEAFPAADLRLLGIGLAFAMAEDAMAPRRRPDLRATPELGGATPCVVAGREGGRHIRDTFELTLRAGVARTRVRPR